MSSTPSAVYKIILIGDAGVGKTTCLAKFSEQYKKYENWQETKEEKKDEIKKIFFTKNTSPAKQQPTIGVEFESFDFSYPYISPFEKSPKKQGEKANLKIQIWDTAGQERYRAITKAHYRRANAAMLFFDTSDRKTFVNVKDVWWPEVRDAASDATGLSDSISLVQNKIDLEKKYKDNLHEGFCGNGDGGNKRTYPAIQSFKEDNKFLHAQTSATTGEGVLDAFGKLINQIHEHHVKNQKGNEDDNDAIKVLNDGGDKKGKGCC